MKEKRAELSIDGDTAFALLGDDLQSGEAEYVVIDDAFRAKHPGLSTRELEWAAGKEAFEKLKARLGRPLSFVWRSRNERQITLPAWRASTKEKATMANDEDHYQNLAKIIEATLDPSTPLENLRTVLAALQEGEGGAPQRILSERLALLERLRPYLSETSYRYCVDAFKAH